MFFALLLFSLLLGLASAQAFSDSMALEMAQYTALRSLFVGLNCIAPKCGDFAATDPCPARIDFEDPERIVCVNGSVIEIHLEGGLKGSINGPALGMLTRLTVLELLSHALSTIPSQIGRLTALKVLDLFSCAFTGTVPSQVGALSNLTSLTLASNKLTGTLPALDKLTSLIMLSADNNVGLGGSIPAMPTSIRGVFLQSCAFTALPPNLSALSALTDLRVQLNRLSGPPPMFMSSSTFRRCFLQVSADTNCFDCPSLGIGVVGPCICQPKNATTCAETAALTSSASSGTTTNVATLATDSLFAGVTLTHAPTSIRSTSASASVTMAQEMSDTPTSVTPTSVTPTSSTSTSASGNVTSATAPEISRSDLGGVIVVIGSAAAALFLVGLGVFCIVRRCRRLRRAKSASAELKPQQQPAPAADYAQIVISPLPSDYDRGRLDADDDNNEPSIVAALAHSKSNYDMVPTQPNASDYDSGRIG
jgi:hypothetical protein